MNRRAAITLLGTSIGALAGAGLYGRHAFLPPAPSDPLESVEKLALRLYESMAPSLRREACVDYDHPLRQYHNRGVRGGGIPITSGNFSREQRGVLTDLLYAGLSEEGRRKLPHQFFINWPGVHLMSLVICGDPNTSQYQIVLSGPHMNMRLGGRSREGVAFGGPQIYGDQRGNYRPGLPGNIYRYQLRIARRLFDNLGPGQKQAALLPLAPVQTQIELQGSDGSFPGLPVSDLSGQNRPIVTELLDGILSTYNLEDVAYAKKCLDENGGIDSLFLSYYEKGEEGSSGELQIFRLEGPAAVLYFRGHPHLHAFINIGMNGDAPLSVGEVVGTNPAVLEGRELKRLFEEVMLDHTGTDFAYYHKAAAVGRLRQGLIRTGDIYNLESWQDTITVVEIKGSNIRGRLLAQLRDLGTDPEPGRIYTVATSGYAAYEEDRDSLRTIESRRRGGMLRDATIDYLRKKWAASA